MLEPLGRSERLPRPPPSPDQPIIDRASQIDGPVGVLGVGQEEERDLPGPLGVESGGPGFPAQIGRLGLPPDLQ